MTNYIQIVFPDADEFVQISTPATVSPEVPDIGDDITITRTVWETGYGHEVINIPDDAILSFDENAETIEITSTGLGSFSYTSYNNGIQDRLEWAFSLIIEHETSITVDIDGNIIITPIQYSGITTLYSASFNSIDVTNDLTVDGDDLKYTPTSDGAFEFKTWHDYDETEQTTIIDYVRPAIMD